MKQVLSFFILAAFSSTTVFSQIKIMKKLNRDDLIKKENSKVITSPRLEPLTKQQSEKVQLFNACLVKAALHRLNPAAYPLTSDENSLERKALKIVNAVSEKQFGKAKTRIQKLTSTTDPLRLRLLGSLNNIDLSKESVMDQLPEAQYKVYTSQLVNFFKSGIKLEVPKPDINGVDFIVHSIHCVDETDPETPGEDDMVLGGLVFEIGKTANVANGFYAGQFDDKEANSDYPYYQQYGEHLFGITNVNTIGYPKNFACMLVLVEEDTDDNGQQVATDLNNALAQIGGTICDAYVTGCSMFIQEAAQAVNGIIALLFTDDLFPPYTVTLTLSSKNDFGSSMESGNLATPEIYGAGGKYKVGYKWKIRQ